LECSTHWVIYEDLDVIDGGLRILVEIFVDADRVWQADGNLGAEVALDVFVEHGNVSNVGWANDLSDELVVPKELVDKGTDPLQKLVAAEVPLLFIFLQAVHPNIFP